MTLISKKDLDLMIEVEDLLHDKLEKTNGKKETYKGATYIRFDENDKEYEVWLQYWNMIERFLNDRQKAKERSKKREGDLP
ncbi:MAG: hypothetical protein J6T15_03890 [Bacilli bacterium]|nr:hypothetical protein [Bacilli bacterium]